jgi:hypothetical protein
MTLSDIDQCELGCALLSGPGVMSRPCSGPRRRDLDQDIGASLEMAET